YMITTIKCIRTVSLIALLGSLALFTAQAGEKPAVLNGKNPAIEVTRINPSKADLRKLEKKRSQDGAPAAQAGEAQVHVVKLHVKMPPPTDQAWVLYVGDTRIREYGSCADGIFFKVNDRKDLEAWQGKSVRFVLKNEVAETGVTFPAAPNQASTRLPELSEVLK